MCTSYCKEVKDLQEQGRTCCNDPSLCHTCHTNGHGLQLPYNSSKRLDESAAHRVLSKSHGIAFGSQAPVQVDALQDKLREELGTCGDPGMDGLLTVIRNPFDTLVSRYHLACDNNHSSCIGREQSQFLRYEGMWVENMWLMDDATPPDLCTMLQWHHRAALARRSCPSRLMSYESMISDTQGYLSELADLLGYDSVDSDCGASVTKDNTQILEAGLPSYLNMFDAASIVRVSNAINIYLERSKNLTTPSVAPCNFWKTSPALQASACNKCHGCCNVWPGTLEQWEMARLEISNVSVADDVEISRPLLRDFLSVAVPTKDGSWPNIGSDESSAGGFYFVDAMGHKTLLSRPTCVAAFNGKLLVYERVYKSGSESVCRNMRRVNDDSLPLPCNHTGQQTGSCSYSEVNRACISNPSLCFVFTFVREPLGRLVSSYSEISWRVGKEQTLKGGNADLESVFQRYTDESSQAKVFLEDMVSGHLHKRSRDAHVFAQVGFLTRVHRELPRIPARSFIGKLESIETDWDRIGELLKERGAAKPDTKFKKWMDVTGHHNETDRLSNSTARRAMEELLLSQIPQGHQTKEVPRLSHLFETARARVDVTTGARVRNVYLIAACRMLLPDFICLGYPLPPDCAAAIEPHNVTCPLNIVERPNVFRADAESIHPNAANGNRSLQEIIQHAADIPRPNHSKPADPWIVPAPACYANLSRFLPLPLLDERNFTIAELSHRPHLADAGVCIVDQKVNHGNRTCLPSLILIGTARGGTGEFLNYALSQDRLSVLGEIRQGGLFVGEGHFFGRHIPITLSKKKKEEADAPNSTTDGEPIQSSTKAHVRTRLNQQDIVIPGEDIFAFDDHGYELMSVDKHALRYYMSQFPPNEGRWSFEKTPGYFQSAAIPELHAFLPSVRLLLLLRDPVSRTYSSFTLKSESGRKIGLGGGPRASNTSFAFDEVLARKVSTYTNCTAAADHACKFHAAVDISFSQGFDAPGSIGNILSQALYSSGIEELSKYYGCGQLYVATSEEFFADQAAFMNRIWLQLGMPEVAYRNQVASKSQAKTLNHEVPMLETTKAWLSKFFSTDRARLHELIPGLDLSLWPVQEETSKELPVAVICVEFGNEMPHVAEFVEYHLAVGISHIYATDGGIEDESRKVLESFPSNQVTVLDGSAGNHNTGGCVQRIVADHGLENPVLRVVKQPVWIFGLDADEYVAPSSAAQTVPEVLATLERAGHLHVALEKVWFGGAWSDHAEKCTTAPLLARFTRYGTEKQAESDDGTINGVHVGHRPKGSGKPAFSSRVLPEWALAGNLSDGNGTKMGFTHHNHMLQQNVSIAKADGDNGLFLYHFKPTSLAEHRKRASWNHFYEKYQDSKVSRTEAEQRVDDEWSWMHNLTNGASHASMLLRVPSLCRTYTRFEKSLADCDLGHLCDDCHKVRPPSEVHESMRPTAHLPCCSRLRRSGKCDTDAISAEARR
tara:strand:- start:3563 stop:7957 length:4395 start_codon:yes stop_codon:yes gene_type:complete